MREAILFSRCYRTHSLFRAAWLKSLECLGFSVDVVLRRYNSDFRSGLIGMLFLVKRNILNGDLVIACGLVESLFLMLLPRSRSRVYVLTGLGRLYFNSFSWNMVTLCLKWFVRRSRVLVLNEDDHTLLCTILGDRVKRIHGEGYRWRDTSWSEKRDIDYLYVGRLLKSKGVDKMVKEFNRLDVGQSKKLVLVGDVDFGNSDSISNEFLEEVASYEGVELLGFKSDVFEYLKRSSCYISLSLREGMPFSVLEAINAGCDLILSDVPGHRELAARLPLKLVEGEDDLYESIPDHLRLSKLSKCEVKERVGCYLYDEVVEEIKALLREINP